MGSDTSEFSNSTGGKKKKKYALFLYETSAANMNDFKLLDKAVVNALPEYLIIRLRDPDEALKVLLLKNIDIIIIDSSFFNNDIITIEYALEIKKHKNSCIFFVPGNEKILIKEYQKKMFAYQEKDDYFINPVDPKFVAQKLRFAASQRGRSNKRFLVSEKAAVLRFDIDEEVEVTLTDISLSGIGLSVDNSIAFQRNEQIKINIPLAPFGIFHRYYGQFLKLSGKVQRVSLAGNQIGCSLEHLTPLQTESLMTVIESVYWMNKSTKQKGSVETNN